MPEPTWDFASAFEHLTGNAPFPWQRALYASLLQGAPPAVCSIPTGLGKTSVLALWLLALAESVRAGQATRLPRRLAYVVNRRTVVDQATREAELLRENMAGKAELRAVKTALLSLCADDGEELPLAVSTLRGAFADNAEWRHDPARPAIVVGTVDMVGSRLLFNGYACGFKSRPLHAGFLGQDTLLVHDEAHLEPAFQELLEAVVGEQGRCQELRPLQVLALSATSRYREGERDHEEPFALTAADHEHAIVRQRVLARKGLTFFAVEDDKQLPAQVAQRALAFKDSGQAILVFVFKLEHLKKVEEQLKKEVSSEQIQVLTGTMRGQERDDLAEKNPIFARFLHQPTVKVKDGTVYLLCTSAGEVGVDLSADHMVCDLAPFDSMAQRLGRVNRRGAGDAQVAVVYSAQAQGAASAQGRDLACQRTLPLLQQLPLREDGRHDACPMALGALPRKARLAAFTPTPEILPTSDILFDAWALTTLREHLPGRPPVAPWLHGEAEWEPPQTHVAWREEVGRFAARADEQQTLGELLEDYPLKPWELLHDTSLRVHGELSKLSERSPDLLVWYMNKEGEGWSSPLAALVADDEERLKGATVVLPADAGGLTEAGLLDGAAQRGGLDVADREDLLRCRKWSDEPVVDPPVVAQPGGIPAQMRLLRTLDVYPGAEGETPAEEEGDGGERPARYWHWLVLPGKADDDGSRTALSPLTLPDHLSDAQLFASRLVAKLQISEPEAACVVFAAAWHDQGKARRVWQRSIGNRSYPQQVLAKSGGRDMRQLELGRYRHEFGSLIDVAAEGAFQAFPSAQQELILHLIAAHHGRARPHFPGDEAFDPERPSAIAAAVAREVPRRYASLQRRYGRWGLCYLESLVRAADALASQRPPSQRPRTAAQSEPGAPTQEPSR